MISSPRTLAIAQILALLAACKPARGEIFEWVPVDEPVAGASGPWTGGAGAGGIAGHPAEVGDAGTAGAGMMGQSGTRAPLDQNVEFTWSETLPGGGACRGGWYVGGFTCTVDNVLAPRLEGTIDVNFEAPSEAQQLEVASGLANVYDPTGAVSFATAVVGKAECSSRNFTAEIPEKIFTGEQVGLGFQLLVGLVCGTSNAAKGTLMGRLDPDGLAVNGRVSIMIGTCTCNGDFDLRATR